MPTDQETIERAVIGKRVVAVSWLPVSLPFDGLGLESITLEGGTKLRLSAWITNLRERDVVVIEVEESEDVDT